MDQHRARSLLVLTSTFPRWEDDKEPRFVEHLALALADRFDITVLAPHARDSATAEKRNKESSSINVVRFRYFLARWQTLAYDGGILANLKHNRLNYLLIPFFLVSQLLAIARLDKATGFEAIHAHWIIPQGLAATIYRRFWRATPKTLIVTCHGGDLFALNGRWLLPIKRWILNSADEVTVVSHAMRTCCIEMGIPENKIHVRSMGVDLETSFTAADRPAKQHDLIFVGRLVEKKGVSVLLAALQKTLILHPDLALAIVGDGPDLANLKRLVSELRIENNVEFLGSKLNSEIPTLLRAADIFVMPSIVAQSGDQEGLGLVAIEAMGCGCAVVASDLPAIRDTVVNEETGLVARAGDASDFASKIHRLVENPALRDRLAHQANVFARRRFNWTSVASGYANLFNDAISRNV